jgi:hypothetical protein
MKEKVLVDQRRERGQGSRSVAARERLRGFDREGAGEDTQPLEEVALRVGEQPIVARIVKWRAGASRRPADGASSDDPR